MIEMLVCSLGTVTSTVPVAPAPVEIGGPGVGVGALPLGVHATAVTGLIAGLLLWALGGRMIKVAMALLGGALGAGLGAMLVPTVGLASVAGFPGHVVGLAGGAVVGLVAAFLLFRFAMVIAGAGVIGAGAGLAGLVYVTVAPPPPDLRGPGELAPIVEWEAGRGPADSGGAAGDAAPVAEGAVRDLVRAEAEEAVAREATAAGDGLRSMVSPDTAAAVEAAAERVRAFVRGVWDAFADQWNGLDAAQRLVLAGFVVIGMAGGALVGLVMPTKSAAMLTALAGSAVWLASLAWLAEAMRLPGREVMGASGQASVRWLIVWPVVATIGLVFQWRNLKSPAGGSRGRARRESGNDGEGRDRD